MRAGSWCLLILPNGNLDGLLEGAGQMLPLHLVLQNLGFGELYPAFSQGPAEVGPGGPMGSL